MRDAVPEVFMAAARLSPGASSSSLRSGSPSVRVFVYWPRCVGGVLGSSEAVLVAPASTSIVPVFRFVGSFPIARAAHEVPIISTG